MKVSREAMFRDVEPQEALGLVSEGSVHVLDVRTPREYEARGHIPGAILLPVDLILAAAATLPRDGKPVFVCCEHGARSRQAAVVLARAGFAEVLNLAGGMSRWRGPRERAPGVVAGPSSWLLECAELLPPGGTALDVACGTGRHALLLAGAGFRVRAVDRDASRIEALRAAASRLGLPVEAEVLDLELEGAGLGLEAYDVVVVFHYLHRPLFPALIHALRPGGLLLYETFTAEQAARGRPKNPDYLLKPGELRLLLSPLEVLREREGEFDGRMVAGVAARKAEPDSRG